MIKIDSHNHYWHFDTGLYPWIDNTMKILQRNFLPEDITPLLMENGIDGIVAVQASHSETETELLLKLAE